MSEAPAARTYTTVHHTTGPAPDMIPVHNTGTAPQYRNAPVTVISSPAVDAAVVAGRARGYADGLAKAREQAEADRAARQAEHERMTEALQHRVNESVAAMHQAAASLSATDVSTLETAHQRIMEASVELARRILGAELSDASVDARAAIARAMSTPAPSPVQAIRMHPAAAEAAEATGRVPEGVRIIADVSLPAGAARAEYEDGWLEAGVDAALERINTALAEARMVLA